MTNKTNKNESVNKVNNTNKTTKKVETTTKNIESIITKFNENTKGLLFTNLGNKKSSLYKENLFIDLSDKEKRVCAKNYEICFSVQQNHL